MTDPNAVVTPRAPSNVPDPIRIVHLTDLHHGRGFNYGLWQNASDIICNLNPNVIIVTGDLVNSPFHWLFRRARKTLDELNNKCRPTHLFVIPGNHDTRVSGIFPVSWIFPLVAVLFVTATVIFLAGMPPRLYYTIAVFAAVILLFRCLLAKFDYYFGNLVPPLPFHT